ncbi:MAG: MBOAT family protein [Polyangia bacterium]|nr:MBOAT family protein [Polyangia bacterium]
MLFNSIEFILFLVVVFAATWMLARLRLAQVIFLLAASYFFYANWNPYYLVLIWVISTVDFVAGGAIARASDPRARKRWLAFSVAVDLGMLGVFKYFNFFATQAAASCTAMGFPADPVLLGVALPVGISFFTFQSMSYTIDIYRRELEPTPSYLRYLLFVAFFPQLVAGPIVRAATFLPQLASPRSLDSRQGGLGLFLIMSGLVKKVCIADYLAVNLVDRVFERPDWFTSAEVLTAIYAYAFQIYCDFSGYSDVAIGAALILGFQLPDNFNSPYVAVNLRDFWRRWHISLSTWLRDYLYIPLGGSKKGPGRTYFALAMTMLLGGLWHGPAWTFVVWGALHGAALAATRFVQRLRPARNASPAWWTKALCALATFHFVCFAWVFFRSASFGHAERVLAQLLSGTGGVANIGVTLALALCAAVLMHLFPQGWLRRVQELFSRLPAPVQGAAMAGVGALVYSVAQSKTLPFIYFQF